MNDAMNFYACCKRFPSEISWTRCTVAIVFPRIGFDCIFCPFGHFWLWHHGYRFIYNTQHSDTRAKTEKSVRHPFVADARAQYYIISMSFCGSCVDGWRQKKYDMWMRMDDWGKNTHNLHHLRQRPPATLSSSAKTRNYFVVDGAHSADQNEPMMRTRIKHTSPRMTHSPRAGHQKMKNFQKCFIKYTVMYSCVCVCAVQVCGESCELNDRIHRWRMMTYIIYDDSFHSVYHIYSFRLLVFALWLFSPRHRILVIQLSEAPLFWRHNFSQKKFIAHSASASANRVNSTKTVYIYSFIFIFVSEKRLQSNIWVRSLLLGKARDSEGSKVLNIGIWKEYGCLEPYAIPDGLEKYGNGKPISLVGRAILKSFVRPLMLFHDPCDV